MNGPPVRPLGATPIELALPVPRGRTMRQAIRAFGQDDIPRVAGIFAGTFRRGGFMGLIDIGLRPDVARHVAGLPVQGPADP